MPSLILSAGDLYQRTGTAVQQGGVMSAMNLALNGRAIGQNEALNNAAPRPPKPLDPGLPSLQAEEQQQSQAQAPLPEGGNLEAVAFAGCSVSGGAAERLLWIAELT